MAAKRLILDVLRDLCQAGHGGWVVGVRKVERLRTKTERELDDLAADGTARPATEWEAHVHVLRHAVPLPRRAACDQPDRAGEDGRGGAASDQGWEVAVLPEGAWEAARAVLEALGVDQDSREDREHFARTGRVLRAI